MLTVDNAIGNSVTFFNDTGVSVRNPKAADLDVWLGVANGSLLDLYKANNNGGGESGSLYSSYDTTFIPVGGESNEKATVDYVSGSVPGGQVFVLAKDGNSSPNWYVWFLSGLGTSLGQTSLGWNGTDSLLFDQLFPGNGSISHVLVMGQSEKSAVPDGGATIALLGLALLGLGVHRWMVCRA